MFGYAERDPTCSFQLPAPLHICMLAVDETSSH